MNGAQAVLRIPDVSPEMTEIDISPEVIVAGDHPAVLVMTDTISSLGVKVTLLHPFENLERLIVPLRPMMEADERVEKIYSLLFERVSNGQNIKVLDQSTIEEISGWWGNYSLKVRQKGSLLPLETSGLALAFKGTPVLPDGFSNEGVESFTGFFAQLINHKAPLEKVTNPIKRIAFILDVDGKDEKWASVMALRFGAHLRNFGSQVYILCRDLKVSVDDMEREYRLARESGILIMKYRELPKIEGSGKNFNVMFRDASAVSAETPLEILLQNLDAVVVQETFVPGDAQERLLNQLRIPIEEGFVGPNNPQFVGRTTKKGVVVAGDTWFPEYPTDSVTTALSASEELYQWTGKGTYKVDVQRVAEVDPSKCATCLTCYRICPHDSIRVERYGERNVYITPGEKEGPTWEAARVKVETCNGCGLCASECPAKAIQLVYYPDLEVLEFLKRS